MTADISLTQPKPDTRRVRGPKDFDWGFTVPETLPRQVPATLLDTQHWAPQLISNYCLIIRQVCSEVGLKEVGKALHSLFFHGEWVAGEARQRFLTLTGGVGCVLQPSLSV